MGLTPEPSPSSKALVKSSAKSSPFKPSPFKASSALAPRDLQRSPTCSLEFRTQAIQRTLTVLTAHQNRWRMEMAEVLDRIGQVAMPMELSQYSGSFGVIVQQALMQLDDDQFAQWVAAVWGDRHPQAPGELEDWGVATLES